MRKHHKLTQKELAEKLNISVGYVRMLERGQIPARLGIMTIWDVHRLFGIPIDDLLERCLEKGEQA